MEGNKVSDMVQTMQKFGWIDYVVFVMMLAISAAVGVYWGFMKKQRTQLDYLLGGRNMQVIPVAMSLVASFISGITLLGLPTEVYMYGTQYALIIVAIILIRGGSSLNFMGCTAPALFKTNRLCLMMFVVGNLYLPVFHELQITSNYEYLSMRFDNRVRLFGSIVFAVAMIGWLPIVIYVPALAFNQVTGVDIHIITPVVCLVCIFYTSAGGLQAVVWTDVIQITAMFGAMTLVAIKGTLDLGGFSVVWQRNMDSGRIEAPNWDPSPLTRHTVWSLLIGGLIYWVQANAVSQTMVQRYMALPTLRKAKWALFGFVIGIVMLYCLCLYCGLLIYARYHDCDPLKTKLAKAKDQLLPLLVMDVLGDFPGLPGVFVAGIFSAALSSLSTSLNSLSAVVLEDFYKPFFKKDLSERQSNWLMRSVVILLGVLCVGLVVVVEKMGTVLQLTMTLESMAMGPQLGVFTMGILMPWVDALGALVGGVSGLVLMSWFCLSAQAATARGAIVIDQKPLTVIGCKYAYNATETANVDFDAVEEVSPFLKLSYMWFTVSGLLITVIVGCIVSKINRVRGSTHIPPAAKLLAPVIRRFCKEPPHPSEDVFIQAYGNNKESDHNATSLCMKPMKENKDIS